jgi:nitrogen fixation protein FixH
MRPIPVTWKHSGKAARGLVVSFTVDTDGSTYAVVMTEGKFADVKMAHLSFDEPAPVEKGDTIKIEWTLTEREQFWHAAEAARKRDAARAKENEELDYWKNGRITQ